MDFFQNNLKEVIEAINKVIESRRKSISVKLIREINKINANNRSKINFYWRSLKFLVDKKIVIEKGPRSPRSYKIMVSRKISVDDIYP